MIKKIIKIFPNINKISKFLIDEWEITQNDAIKNKGYFSVALSGGNTPVPFFQKLSKKKNEFIWDKTFFFQVDERYVPLDHPDSNYRMIKEILLDKINIPTENIFPINTNLSIKNCTLDYEKLIITFFKNETASFFDLIFLGIGTDGHTASLFPGDRALTETERLSVSVNADNIKHKRITLTYPIINNSKKIIFLATGYDKAQIIKEIIEKKNNSYPASNINPKNGSILFVLDDKAGSKLINIS